MSFIPSIGTKGLFKLKAPLDSLLVKRVPYTCVGVRNFQDVLGLGEDPISAFYEPLGLTEDDYNTDYDNGVVLVSLKASDANFVVVPSSYIDGYPDVGGVQYVQMVLAASLGPIPEGMILDAVMQKVKDVVKEYVGIDSDINLIATSLPTIVPNTDHETMEAARQAQIASAGTDYSRYLETKEKLDEALIKITELENHIISRNIT